jgi:hypothetical protein
MCTVPETYKLQTSILQLRHFMSSQIMNDDILARESLSTEFL